MAQKQWYKGAVIYQVYPRSFQDTNGDGIGDIKGIIDRIDYIKSLGVDAIWVSPFFKSPMKDFGYDISDYRDIDPLFGNLDDFDELIAQAHQRDIKIIIDQVLSHTSDQHQWFLDSREDKINDKADWYVWADAKPDGTQPNNWLSIFGGPAWQWEPRRGQYYLHNFFAEQPDLNFHNPEVRKAVLDNVEFWLKKGVDGFRLESTFAITMLNYVIIRLSHQRNVKVEALAKTTLMRSSITTTIIRNLRTLVLCRTFVPY